MQDSRSLGRVVEATEFSNRLKNIPGYALKPSFS